MSQAKHKYYRKNTVKSPLKFTKDIKFTVTFDVIPKFNGRKGKLRHLVEMNQSKQKKTLSLVGKDRVMTSVSSI